MADNISADQTNAIAQLQNIARQLGQWAQSQNNALPPATASSSPSATPVALSTTATTIIAASSSRHGIIFHNPGTANAYVFPSLTSTAPTTASVGGSFIIYPGGTLAFPSSFYPNVNCGWSGFSGTGSNQAFTVVEFF